ncbi:hypothetical protein MML48_1g14216 [Holotrichia oblita]|uniref:Uncharacterized protein n=1 Tax=Holotrichia oblita TaxID=644536 RepID=A0ACB9TZ30_HOLOL|nr:hypothetical protein MML48_1g14216 [Holotrichia oblita]
MAPLSNYYEQEVRKWLISHPGRVVTIGQVGKLYNAAFQRAASVQTAVKGFEKTGICPFNRHVFPDYLFAPSETTERPLILAEPQRAAATSEPTTDLPSTSFTVSPSVLRPLPREEKRIQNRNDKRRGKTVILTSSPYKKELQDEEEEKRKPQKNINVRSHNYNAYQRE